MYRSFFGQQAQDLRVFLEFGTEGVSSCTFFQSCLCHCGELRDIVVFS